MANRSDLRLPDRMPCLLLVLRRLGRLAACHSSLAPVPTVPLVATIRLSSSILLDINLDSSTPVMDHVVDVDSGGGKKDGDGGGKREVGESRRFLGMLHG